MLLAKAVIAQARTTNPIFREKILIDFMQFINNFVEATH